MNCFYKRCLSILAAGTLVLGGAVAMAQEPAEDDLLIMPISANTEDNAPAVYVDGLKLEADPIVNADGTYMLPLRAMMEKLGFQVEWNMASNLIVMTKGPVQITANPFEDGYTFAKTAPMKLGSAPVVKNDTTYVPEAFVAEILQGKYVNNGEFAYVTLQDTAEKIAMNAEVKEVMEDGRILIGLEGIEDHTIALNLTDDTVLEDKDGNAIEAADITKGDMVYAEFSSAMTKSIPPQSNAIKIQVLKKAEATDEVAQEESRYYGLVSKIEDNTLYMDGVDMDCKLVVHISDETVFQNEKGEEIALSDIKENTYLDVLTSPAYTASLPPQTTAVSVSVLNFEETTAEVISVEENQIVASVKDGSKDVMDQIVFNLNANTKIYKDGQLMEAKDLEKGAKIEVKHSMAMTFSIPPQTYAYIINAK